MNNKDNDLYLIATNVSKGTAWNGSIFWTDVVPSVTIVLLFMYMVWG